MISYHSFYLCKPLNSELPFLGWWAAEKKDTRTGTGVGRGERTIALEKVRDVEKIKLDTLTSQLSKLEKIRSVNKDLIKHKQDSVMDLTKKEQAGFLEGGLIILYI